jgi:L-ribulose-5-phosphate 4-epimerase
VSHRELREEVYQVNKGLVEAGLVVLTWGNASGIDRQAGIIAIKPSGVDYDRMTPDDMVLVDLETGHPVKGSSRPSSDTPTHVCLYRAFPDIGGIVHTHSHCATIFSQARVPIPCFGTTHADNFHGEIPVTRCLTDDEISDDYEWNTGEVIVERFREGSLEPNDVPGILVACHAPFAWGKTPAKALENAIVLEYVAKMALETVRLNPDVAPITDSLLDKHFLRKHGPGAYYGQRAAQGSAPAQKG